MNCVLYIREFLWHVIFFLKKMLFSTLFIANIKNVTKKRNSLAVLQQLSSPSLVHTTPDPFPQSQFNTEPVHWHFHRKQSVPGM